MLNIGGLDGGWGQRLIGMLQERVGIGLGTVPGSRSFATNREVVENGSDCLLESKVEL